MFCPDCGKAEQIPNSHCRNCGNWLVDSNRKNQLPFGGYTPQDTATITLSLNVLSVIAAFISAIALYAIFIVRENIPAIVYLVIASFCICIGVWQTLNIYAGLQLKKRFKEAQNQNKNTQPELTAEGAKQNYELPPANTQEFVTPFSVTEDNTKFLTNFQESKCAGRRKTNQWT